MASSVRRGVTPSSSSSNPCFPTSKGRSSRSCSKPATTLVPRSARVGARSRGGDDTLADLLVEDDRAGEALELLAKIPESADTRRIAAKARVGADDEPIDAALDERLSGLLPRVKDDEAARQEYLDVLELLGADDPRTAGYRKALTAQLF